MSAVVLRSAIEAAVESRNTALASESSMT